ncbi:MAG: glutamate 5-kinase [Chloroflexi bacterium]|jgi:glutamate 5-kinase|nr:glutamate 5-kinase [Chloroflexota bacterium]
MSQNRIVVKVGTSTLTDGTHHLNRRRMLELAQQMVQLREQGHEVVLVSSGAMAAGREHLGVTPTQRPKKAAALMPYKQMLAAVGQSRLMMAWEQVFGMFEVKVAQVLLTRADLSDRHRYLNAREALLAILAHGIVPIVNENDAVVTEEIRVGDNDNLSALVANVVDADILIILTDQDGLFTADPRKDPAATLIHEVSQIDDNLRSIAGVSSTNLGVGGMATKLQAADLATKSGIAVVLAHGKRVGAMVGVANGEKIGTRFLPQASAPDSRQRWILSDKTAGGVRVDEGAAQAIAKGKSLLHVGVRAVLGKFERGAVITVCDDRGEVEIAKGITRCSSAEAIRLMGKKSTDVAALLGGEAATWLIHADDLVKI